MDDLLKRLADKRYRLGRLDQLEELLDNLRQWYRVELTYTSNALEGNTLGRLQTSLVIEKDQTIAGKSLTEHLEAVGHARAVDHIWDLASQSKTDSVSVDTIFDIHRLVLGQVDPDNAARLRRTAVRVAGSQTVFPNHLRVSALLDDLVNDIRNGSQPCLKAAQAHLQLVSIHPFADGNGRTARLLMNLILMQSGYPPAIIRKRDRLKYLQLLEDAQTGGDFEPFCAFIFGAIDRSLDICLKPEKADLPQAKLIKIGDLARLSQETVSTLRYWTDQGLLPPADISASKYRWYNQSAVVRVKLIRQLQAQRFNLGEIKQKMKLTLNG